MPQHHDSGILTLAEVTTEPLAEVAKKLPAGRLYSNGKGFVPNVRRDLYAKLAAALGIPTGLSAEAEMTPLVASGLPRTWDEIAPGHLVIAQESHESDGWWEAIVIERDGDMLTLRWRDYPKQAKVVRHRDAVALLHAAP